MKRSKRGGKICDFCENCKLKKIGNFCKIQKFTEQYKAVKEEVERGLNKTCDFCETFKKLDKHEIDNFQVVPLASVYNQANCEAIDIKIFFW